MINYIRINMATELTGSCRSKTKTRVDLHIVENPETFNIENNKSPSHQRVKKNIHNSTSEKNMEKFMKICRILALSIFNTVNSMSNVRQRVIHTDAHNITTIMKCNIHSPLKCFGQHTNSTPENNEIPHGNNIAKLLICILRS